MFKLEFETDNAAFDGDDLGGEVARILGDVTALILSGEHSMRGTVRDVNGNTVGAWELT